MDEYEYEFMLDLVSHSEVQILKWRCWANLCKFSERWFHTLLSTSVLGATTTLNSQVNILHLSFFLQGHVTLNLGNVL